MTKTNILLVLVLAIQFTLQAQQPQGFINRSPDFLQIATPNVAAFNKYIDHPVSLYTGTPEISVPIYNLNDGQVKLPLSLTYNSSGIKADEEASWVGLGWNLNAGGVITQNVVGGDDFNDTQYHDLLSKFNIDASDVSTANYSNVDYTLALHLALDTYIHSTTGINQAGKLNPDVFYFSYPRGSGKFIVDYRNDSVYVLSRQSNIKIDKQWDILKLQIVGFRITTDEGIVHNFSERTKLHDIALPENVSKSYVLTNSIYPNGQIVSYTYDTYETIKYSRNENLQAVVPGQSLEGPLSGEHSVYSYSDVVNLGEEFYLKGIATSNYLITFSVSNRDDYVNGKKLDNIRIEPRIKQSDSQIKSFNLKYDYFVADSNSQSWTPPTLPDWGYISTLAWKADYGSKRLKLTSLTQTSGVKTNDKYEFIYDETVKLPNKHTYEIDYWGYYNGKNGPDTYMPYLKPLLWARTVESRGKETVSNSYEGWSQIKCRDRGYDFNFCKAGMLKGIKYPTGGYTEYNYEPNSFIDYPIPTINQVYVDPSLKTVTAQDYNGVADVTTARISINKPTYAKVTITLNKGMNSWSDMWNTSMADSQKPVAFIGRNTATGFDRIIKTYDGFADQCIYYANHFPNESSIIIKDSFLLDIPVPDQTYEYFVDVSYKLNPAIINYGDSRSGSMLGELQYSSGDTNIEKVDVQGCGLRIKTISSYDKQGDVAPILTTSYEYKNPKTDKSSGILHDILRFTKEYNGALNYGANLNNNQPGVSPGSPGYHWPDLILYPINLIQICSNNNASNPYGSNGGVGYSYVKETRRSSNTFAGYTLSTFENNEPAYAETSVRVDDPRNGKLLKTEVYNQNNLLIKKDSFIYSIKVNHQYLGLNITNRLNMFPGIFSSPNFTLVPFGSNQPGGNLSNSEGYIDPSLHGTQKSILIYHLNICDVIMMRKLTVLDKVSTKEDYSYNINTLQLKGKDISLENGDILSYKYTYPNDYGWYPYDIMTNENRISNVIEEKIFRNNLFVSGTLTEYKLVPVGGGAVAYTKVPSIKHFSKMSEGISDPVTFTANGTNNAIYPENNIVYDTYDQLGNINYMFKNDVDKAVYLWSYNYQYPIAKIEGLSYTDVVNILPTGYIGDLAANFNPTADQINAIRTYLAPTRALVSTYTYKPLSGLLSKTDPRGATTHYTYDSFDRLYLVRNDNKNILAKYSYGYQNNPDNGQGGYNTPSVTVTLGATNYVPGAIGTASLDALTGGSGNYVYNWYLKNSSGDILWSSLNTTTTSISYSCSQTGILTVQCVVTDNVTGQTATDSKNVTCYTVPTASVAIGAAYYVLNSAGTATVAAGNGSNNFSYSWALKNGSGTVLQTSTSSSFSYTCSQAGILTVQCVVTDNVTGQTATDYKNVTCYTVPTVSVAIGAAYYVLNGAGTATVAAGNGSNNFSYSWALKNGSGTVLQTSTSSSFSYTCSQSGPLTVQCVVTDNVTGQTATDSKNVTCYTVPTASVAIGAAYYMLNGAGTATVAAGNGSNNFSYSWALKNGSGTVLQTGTSGSFSYTCSQAGTLTVQCVVTDNVTGQTATDSKSVTCYTIPAASVTIGASYYMLNGAGTATVAAGDGSNNFSYSWALKNVNGTVLQTSTSASFSYTCSQAGILTVQCVVTDNVTGQTATDSKNVTCYTVPTASVAIGAAYYVLNGAGTATVAAGNGSNNFSYSWALKNGSGTVLQTSTSGSFSYTCSQAGILTVQCVVTDNVTGQTATDSKNVTCYIVPTASVAIGAAYYVLNGAGTATVAAGNGSNNFSYSWALKNVNGTVLQTSTSASFSYTCSQAGILTVQCVVTDNITGQSVTASNTVNCYSALTGGGISVGSSHYILNATGTANVFYSNNSGSISYNWTLKNSSGVVLQSSTSSSFSFICSQAGKLTVQCVVTDNITGLSISPSQDFTCYTTPTASVAVGAAFYMLNGTGSATVSAGGGSGDYSYSWSLKNSSGVVLQSSTSSSFSFSASQSGTLTLQCVVVDNVTGQTATDSKTTLCYTIPALYITTSYASYEINTTGTAYCNITGGSGNFAYSWSFKNAGGIILQTGSSSSFSFYSSQSGTFTIVCVVKDNITGVTTNYSKTVDFVATTIVGSITMQSGFTHITGGVSRVGTKVSFSEMFYSTYNMGAGNGYYVASISANCRPSYRQTVSYTTNGRTWSIVIEPSGIVYMTIDSGSYLPAYTSVSIGPIEYYQ